MKRLNLITEQLAALDFNSAPGYLINGLKREELVASNSMILHELFFDSLGEQSERDPVLKDAQVRQFGSVDRWRAEAMSAVGQLNRSQRKRVAPYPLYLGESASGSKTSPRGRRAGRRRRQIPPCARLLGPLR